MAPTVAVARGGGAKARGEITTAERIFDRVKKKSCRKTAGHE